jgi:hypothetical protein
MSVLPRRAMPAGDAGTGQSLRGEGIMEEVC